MKDNKQEVGKVVDAIVDELGRKQKDIIPILQRIQEKFNYLPESALHHVCEISDISPASIEGVATFYSRFRHKPAGRHFIKVCLGTACHVKGAEQLYDAFKRHLNIPEDSDTDADMLFTVEKVACLGCCMLAPAVQIGDITYGFVEPQKVSEVLEDFIKAQEKDTSDKKGYAVDSTLVTGEIRMCLGSSCVASGTDALHEEVLQRLHALQVPAVIKIVGCTGISYQTPLIEISTSDGRSFKYGKVKNEDVEAILLKHFRPRIMKRVAAGIMHMLENMLTDEERKPVAKYEVDMRHGFDAMYFGRQKYIATEHCGKCDPLDIDDYLKHDGFVALQKVFNSQTPDDVIKTIIDSGLRGRGGGGFPTGRKWSIVRDTKSDEKTIIMNGDEGDPGAFMDRMLLESYPYRILEGILIAAFAVGARKCILYIRMEYPLALKRMREAIERMEKRGFLGKNILENEFDLEVSIMEGAGAFVCGEETALIASIEGKRGMPNMRPPYPAVHGISGKPTLINNVETFALVPWIIRHGAESFGSIGTAASKGTKAFALAGKVLRGGLIEVPMGLTLREIVEEIGGGVADGREYKAVQIGGPSGGCIPVSLWDTPVDYEALNGIGAMMGSGGLVVLDDTDCIVDIAQYFLQFTQDQSCGKCTYCRIGTKRMLEILQRLTTGKARTNDLEQLEELAHYVKAGSLCGLGKTAPNPVLTTLHYFRDEYEAHIAGRCPAKKCKSLISYVVTDDCIGCTKCAQVCPVSAIKITPYEKHEIDVAECVRCDTCRRVCPADAIHIETGARGLN